MDGYRQNGFCPFQILTWFERSIIMIATTNSLNTVSSYCNELIKKQVDTTGSGFTLTKEEKENFLSTVKTDTYTSTNSSFTNVTATSDVYTNLIYNNVINLSRQSPYGAMANASNLIAYNGVTYQYSSTTNCLCLGDMKEEDNILSIPLSTGDTLLVNRNNLDDLAKSIGMFVPADQKRIMDAIYTDAKCRSKQVEIEAKEGEVLDSLFKDPSKSKEVSNE